jgi:hypothetical protein
MLAWLTIATSAGALLALIWALRLRQQLARLRAEHEHAQDHQLAHHLQNLTASQQPAEAVIRVTWTKAGTAAYKVRIENIGGETASAVTFHLESSNGYSPLEPDAMQRLFPITLRTGDDLVLSALTSRWMTDPFHATVIWTNLDGAQHKQVFELHYPEPEP